MTGGAGQHPRKARDGRRRALRHRIYCINAARSLFRDEPIEVHAAASGAIGDVEESVSAVLRFSSERLASFTCSFGRRKVSEYRLVGTKGDLVVDPAYEYARPLGARSEPRRQPG